MTERGPWDHARDFERQRDQRDATRREVGESARRTIVVKDVAFKAGSNQIQHRANRRLQGWRLQRMRSGAFFQQVSEAASDDRTLTLLSSGAFTADLEVW